MKKIPLFGKYGLGRFALVDDQDYPTLSKFHWWAQKERKTFYAMTHTQKKLKRTNHIMHRLILSAPKGMQVDHIDGNGLNNRRSNIRVCTMAQNSKNRGMQKDNTSGYKGVSFCGNRYPNYPWSASIGLNKKKIWIGRFRTKQEAWEAYKKKALEVHGEFAWQPIKDEKIRTA